ncbi:N-formylglutamate deformylase [Aureimonas sp. Leaf454]|uniref:N-formylglutamate deformylase n=1 Tax=Aureimonas sp. Leaf454 TaxID=1736381 RepID=UPI0006FD081A|nr:N-formylglutamate deformylase [Aureimonas sp. Leaf454]KQT47414.1 N-formylglutamate deformylase [Aureimonas sp. Leaf454]
MSPFEVRRGASPVILGLPHTGTDLPPEIAARLNDEGLRLRDTDWHIERLYDGLLPEATIVRATFHRYVVDANRDPDGVSLYPGQNTTSLVPETDFDDQPIWRDGKGPTPRDIAERLAAYHAPYHAALAAEIDRVKAMHGTAILYDCHSIRSVVPFLFEGTLPDLNVGTAGGTTCDPRVEAATIQACRAARGYTSVLDGRFKGGWTTRHYGRPASGVHAIQMEIAQSAYLASEAPPFAYDGAKAERLRAVLGPLLATLEALAPDLAAAAPAHSFEGPAR